SQRFGKNKEGLGYSVVPTPAQVYSPPKKDMSWTGLPEFADDTITDYSRPSSSIESNSSDLQNCNTFVSENGESSESIMSKPMIKFVKAADSPTVIKTNKDETVRKSYVKYAEMYRKTSKSSNVRGNTQNIIDDKGYWDSGCSRHITGNISYLSDYEPYDGGYVSFGKGGGKITGKAIIKIGKLEFENVYFVKDLKYNLFSVSQICDNKNSVLFTDSECIVLERKFKLKDDTNASADESMLWHRRLGHLNFKTMNKLVWHNLVKGLPSKCFENNHTCVACLKGKQHKASCKNKLVNLVSKPLHTLHMDLFGPTSDETSDILRNFITEIENLKKLKAEAVNTACFVQNKVLVNKSQNKTLYELFNGRTPAIGFLKPFRCYVMILNTLDHLGKFNAKGDKGYFIGYSMSGKAFRVFNKRTKKVEENLHVDILENKLIEKGAGPNWLFDIDTLTNSMNYVPVVVAETYSTNFSGTKDAVSQDVKKDVSSLRYIALPNWFHEAHLESSTMESAILTVSSPVQTACLNDSPEPSSDTNRVEADLGNMEYNISASPTPTFRTHKDHPKVYQMDVKSAFLYGTIDEEVYMMQPPGFQDPEVLARVYKVEKAMYGLLQAPRAWYGTWSKYLLTNGFQRVLQKKDGIFLSQDKYVGDILKKFGYSDVRYQVTPKECHLHAVKRILRYLKGHPKLGLWYLKESPFGGATQDRKSTTRGCQFLARSHTAKTFDLVWIWLGGDYGNLFLMGYTGIQWIETTDAETKILATVDGKPRTIFKSSIRRNLKPNDEAGISSLPDTKFFENLALMGYNILPNQKITFQKGQFFHQWKYLIHTIMQCLSPKSTDFNELSSNIDTAVGEGSRTPTEPHHTPSPKVQQSPQHDFSSSIHPPATTKTIPSTALIEIPTFRQYSRRAKRIAQSIALPTTADEPASLSRDDSQGEAFPTVFGLEVGQDRKNIIKTSALPCDSTPRVTSLAADEGTQDLEISNLKARIKFLKDKDRGGAEPFREDATIKGRSLETEEEKGVEKSTKRGSNDTKELVNVLTSLDAANIVTSGVQVVSVPPAAEVSNVGVPTGSGLVPTVSPIFTTASVVTPYSRRKGKEKMVESNTSKKKKLQEQIDVQMAREMEEQMAREDQRMNEQIARDAEIARIHAEKEL
nr:hypothetical protein [Tanacetum cinerariifolium]